MFPTAASAGSHDSDSSDRVTAPHDEYDHPADVRRQQGRLTNTRRMIVSESPHDSDSFDLAPLAYVHDANDVDLTSGDKDAYLHETASIGYDHLATVRRQQGRLRNTRRMKVQAGQRVTDNLSAVTPTTAHGTCEAFAVEMGTYRSNAALDDVACDRAPPDADPAEQSGEEGPPEAVAHGGSDPPTVDLGTYCSNMALIDPSFDGTDSDPDSDEQSGEMIELGMHMRSQGMAPTADKLHDMIAIRRLTKRCSDGDSWISGRLLISAHVGIHGPSDPKDAAMTASMDRAFAALGAWQSGGYVEAETVGSDFTWRVK